MVTGNQVIALLRSGGVCIADSPLAHTEGPPEQGREELQGKRHQACLGRLPEGEGDKRG